MKSTMCEINSQSDAMTGERSISLAGRRLARQADVCGSQCDGPVGPVSEVTLRGTFRPAEVREALVATVGTANAASLARWAAAVSAAPLAAAATKTPTMVIAASHATRRQTKPRTIVTPFRVDCAFHPSWLPRLILRESGAVRRTPSHRHPGGLLSATAPRCRMASGSVAARRSTPRMSGVVCLDDAFCCRPRRISYTLVGTAEWPSWEGGGPQSHDPRFKSWLRLQSLALAPSDP